MIYVDCTHCGCTRGETHDPRCPNASESTALSGYVCNCGEPLNDRLVLERVKQIAKEWRTTTLTDGGRFQDFLFKKLNMIELS